MMFIEQIKKISNDISDLGISSYYPIELERDLSQQDMNEEALVIEKSQYIRAHFLKIKHSDKVLVANYSKHGIDGYIGPNSLMELAFGYALGKELYLLNELGKQSCKDEVLGMQPTILNGDITKL